MTLSWANADPLADLKAQFQLSRPRLFLTPAKIARTRQSLTAYQTRFLADLCGSLARLPMEPTLGPIADRDPRGAPHDWGHQARAAALAWVLTADPEYLRKAESWLQWSASWYTERFATNKAVSWYAYSRLAALAAYDWIYNELSDAPRTKIGRQLLEHVARARDSTFIASINGEGSSGPTAGYYGTANLFWYAGLVFLDAGIDDGLADELLLRGHEGHRQMFELRSQAAGDSGGPITASPAYALGDYWKQEFDFFYSWEAATGKSCVQEYPNLARLPEWILRTAIPTPDSGFLDYGVADCPHHDNRLRLPLQYLAQFGHFYAEQAPVLATDGDARRDPSNIYGLFLGTQNAGAMYPFLFDIPETASEQAVEVIRQLPKAKYYPQLGQTFTRSGWASDDTSALFTAGARAAGHKHLDEGHFTIYKHGYQALDTGARLVYAGKANSERLRINWKHNVNHFRRTVAHNCLLIHDPGEDFGAAPMVRNFSFKRANDGGMNQSTGSTMLAFGATDKYTYAAADITAPYNPNKAARVVRHFLHLQPDFFVLYDFVRSSKPEFRKAWLLHTMGEPRVDGDAFHAQEKDGRIRVQAVLPGKAVLRSIGGPGSEFVSGEQNWPLAPEDEKERQDQRHLYGNWRVEISPAEPAETDRFLTFIQVANADDPDLVEAMSVPGEAPTVQFTFQKDTFTVAFNLDGSPGGTLAVSGQAESLPRTITDPLSPEKLQALTRRARETRR